MEAERLAQVGIPDRACQHRRADRLAETAAHPGQAARDDHERPSGDQHQRSVPDHRGGVAGDRDGLAAAGAVAVPAAGHLHQCSRAIGHALDYAHGEGGGAEAGRDEERQNRQHHLVVEVGEKVGDADPDYVAVKPARAVRLGTDRDPPGR